jgi:hypothetical protein
MNTAGFEYTLPKFTAMNVHLIRTEGVSDEEYFDLLDFLRHFNSPYSFITTEEASEISVEEEVEMLLPDDPNYHSKRNMQRQEVSHILMEAPIIYLHAWKDLFDICNRYRRKKRLKAEEVVILLTEQGNELNWFTGFDPKIKGNYFVHTALWEYYTGTDPRYPLAYQVVTLLMKHQMFDSGDKMNEAYHKTTRGCMMDYCEEKKQISIKMRTADICGFCQEIIAIRGISQEVVRYTTELMEYVSNKVKHLNRYSHLKANHQLEIRGYMQFIYIPQMGSKQVRLTPLERAVYLLFLNHPEGIKIAELSKHKQELSEIIHRISRSDNRAFIERGIEELCSPNSNSLSEKMARIRRKFIDAVGEESANSYIISGKNGEAKKISLPRENVKVTSTN